MRSWRIAERDVALDRSCEGARKSGGHWHAEGCPALYAAMTVELAVLEKFVHAEGDQQDLVLVAVDLPDDPALGLDVARDALPDGWDDLDDGGSAAEFGTAFLQQRHHLYMRVPSVIVGEGGNLVINPAHPAYARVKLSIARSYRFDPRMFGRPA
ncbi:RES family NAD+ phosphorylase [Massilia oculi]|uniref:RES family NAD+ phosphorylase n=1 Tax=Massilia hydrophila TaxID=3044279 RepID=A0ABS7Y5N2_9BURK|nr:RES family NAD+ phosphorylase [Massilia oculi]MCA1854966.1 RES family NAD+ phosphorylase [Massilia oculi]